MDIEVLKQAGIDYDAAMARLGGSSDLYETLLKMFLDDTNVEKAQECLANKDYDQLFSHIHEVKGMSGNLSMTNLYTSASDLVAALRAKDYDAIPEGFERVKADYDKAMQGLKTALA